MIGLSNANRNAAGVAIGEEIEIDVVLDVEPRDVVVPADFARALDADLSVRAAFDALAPSHRSEHILAIEGAKRPETRARRIEAALSMLRDPGSTGIRRRGPKANPTASGASPTATQ